MFIHPCIFTSQIEIDMASQRDINKKMIGLWLSPSELADFNEAARRFGTNRTDTLKRLVKLVVSPSTPAKRRN